jgi:hypothetical protein
MPVLWPTILRGADDLQLAMTRDSTTGPGFGDFRARLLSPDRFGPVATMSKNDGCLRIGDRWSRRLEST